MIILKRLVAPLWLAGKTNSQLIVLINKSLLGFPMRLRGLSWNVHRGQLLCITRSSRPRKPWAWCPPALACSAWRKAFLHAAPRERAVGLAVRPFDCEEGWRWCRGTDQAPLLHLGYCLRLRNVMNNTNINTTSHIPHLELMSWATMGAWVLEEQTKSSGKLTFQTPEFPGSIKKMAAYGWNCLLLVQRRIKVLQNSKHVYKNN